jgi:hypothetical protein
MKRMNNMTMSESVRSGAAVADMPTVPETNGSHAANDLTAAPAPGSPVSDDFASGALNTGVWTFVNPQNDGTVSLQGSSLLLTAPAGISHDVWTNGENGIRVMQPVADADFEVEVKFSSALNIQASVQSQGVLVEQDGSNFLRFSMHSDGMQTYIFAASILGAAGSIHVFRQIRGGASTYLRVKRSGNDWRFSYSYDSLRWTTAAVFTQPFHVTQIGPYGGNSQSNGAPAPAFTAVVDYFVNLAGPASAIEGRMYPPAPAPPAVNVWYGDTQNFGQNGQPQQWVNILGDVSGFRQVETLTYSLNGAAPAPLTMGEDEFRLVAPALFNVEIDYASLNPGANTVVITATDTAGLQTNHPVTINYTSGRTWPGNYSVTDWAAAGNIQNVAQIVDGIWQIQPNGTVRTMQTGYDRLIAIGDRIAWRNYVATAEVTLNSIDSFGFAVGIIAGWQGHTTLQYGVPLPNQPRIGHPFPGFGGYSMGYPAPAIMDIFENTPAAPETVLAQGPTQLLQLGVKYVFKFQVQANSSGGSQFSFKVWPAAKPEPTNWNFQADGEASEGSIVLAAHRADVSFGAVSITAV